MFSKIKCKLSNLTIKNQYSLSFVSSVINISAGIMKSFGFATDFLITLEIAG